MNMNYAKVAKHLNKSIDKLTRYIAQGASISFKERQKAMAARISIANAIKEIYQYEEDHLLKG